ncbi:MAG: amidase [Longimicrobiales bacterium]|nr:amidase [Longimicrobiales bacterium]
MNHDEYLQHDATALARRVQAGDLKADELVEIALARIEAFNPRLNAVVRLMTDDARRSAANPLSGPFTGVPFLAKDLGSMYAGHPTSSGSRYLANTVVGWDSELASRVKSTGVSVVGKTNTPEWGLLPVTESALFGPCRNPWDRDLSPGGSSGGAGAAVATGIVPMAGGGDGGGSIRIPASCCGLFGLKPTRGRTPTGPNRGQLWRGATIEHVLTRSVRDSAAMLDATEGPDVGSAFEIAPPTRAYTEEVGAPAGRLKVAWTTTPCVPTDVHPDCIAAVEDAARLLEELGHDVVEDDVPINGQEFSQNFLTVVAGELGADLRDAERFVGRPPGRGDLEPSTRALGLISEALSAQEFAGALRGLELLGRQVGTFFEDYDIILTPTLSKPPPPIGTIGSTAAEQAQLRFLGLFGSGRLMKAAGLIEKAAQSALDFIPWTPIYNVTGHPAMSVPLFWNSAGLPVGVHFVGRFGREDVLFRLAAQLEEARPWFDRLPPIAREPAGAT